MNDFHPTDLMLQMVPVSAYSGELKFPVMHVSVQSYWRERERGKPVVFIGAADDDGERGVGIRRQGRGTEKQNM